MSGGKCRYGREYRGAVAGEWLMGKWCGQVDEQVDEQEGPWCIVLLL